MIKNISGAIGLTILKRKINNIEKKVFIFADNHSNERYCNNSFKNSFNVKTLFDKKKYTSQILLEEVKRENELKLKELWSDSEHTVELKKLYLNNKKSIVPIDVRQYLYTVSWELIDQKLKHLTIKNYLKYFIDFFNYKKVIPDLTKLLKQIIFKTTGIANYFKLLKKKFYKIVEEINLNETVLNHQVKFGNKFLLKFDDIASEIMDWYTIINIFTTKKDTYIHAGLFHTSNIVKVLVNNFNFIITYQSGENNINNMADVSSCVNIV